MPAYYYRGYPRSLHAGDTEEFKVVFADYPVRKATSIVLRFDPGVFGQDNPISMELPMNVFLKDRQSIDELFSENL
jgi:hypothetical protein